MFGNLLLLSLLLQQLLHLPAAAFGAAGAAADAGGLGNLLKAHGPVVNGLDNPEQLDPFADAAGFQPGDDFFFGGHLTPPVVLTDENGGGSRGPVPGRFPAPGSAFLRWPA